MHKLPLDRLVKHYYEETKTLMLEATCGSGGGGCGAKAWEREREREGERARGGEPCILPFLPCQSLVISYPEVSSQSKIEQLYMHHTGWSLLHIISYIEVGMDPTIHY